MTVRIVDIETRVEREEDGRIDGSPYHPDNYIVSVGFLDVTGSTLAAKAEYLFLRHAEIGSDSVAAKRVQELLKTTTVFVAHNAKYDLQWLLESGFTYNGFVYCTQIGEYILARGVKVPLSLESTCERRNLPQKKSDLVHDLFHVQKVGFESMPMDTVREYGIADLYACGSLYLQQQQDYRQPHNSGLVPTLRMSMEFMRVLVEMERTGIAIDPQALTEVEQGYRQEKTELEKTLRDITQDVMGDTPINFSSPAQLSTLIYSRVISDKEGWVRTFNLGKNARGKDLPRPRMTPAEFASSVRKLCTLVKKTKARHCHSCGGTGQVYKTKKSGELYKKSNRCPDCDGKGYILEPLQEYAGLKLSPDGVDDVKDAGFATDSDTLERLIVKAKTAKNDQAVRFLGALSRLNAVDTYLSNFCAGIRRRLRADSILHPNFNQTVTSTARLSSSDPNFQNLPRGSTAPIRRVVVSRWKNGSIMEGDFSGLEFRVAGELSSDQQIFDDVVNGKDVHRQTASIITRKPVDQISKDERQDAKPFTFAPLYGGMGMSYAPHIQKYFTEFMVIYEGVAEWHKRLQDDAVRKGVVTLPSGREYAFPHARRNRWGGVSGSTQIKNYPVQGFATGDIVPCAVIAVSKALRKAQVQSVLINTVHDSIVIDVYPGEEEQVAKILNRCMSQIHEEIMRRYKYKMRIPLACEIKVGSNWLNGKEVHVS